MIRYEESVQDLYERLADLNSQEIPDLLARTEEQGLVRMKRFRHLMIGKRI